MFYHSRLCDTFTAGHTETSVREGLGAREQDAFGALVPGRVRALLGSGRTFRIGFRVGLPVQRTCL